jgi:hypothetical protein
MEDRCEGDAGNQFISEGIADKGHTTERARAQEWGTGVINHISSFHN